ncbi:MAG: phytanoyl-CoA dioxygenase family protein, partial [Rhizobiales bacterium]|nr:phytanoyl-CoA dioxygenase family protein [Hyphomicrobiales bacterium]
MGTAIKRDSHPTTHQETQLKDIVKTLPLRVLSEADWQHWVTRGYVIVRQAVPAENVARLVETLWAFDEKDPADPATWYAPQRRDHIMKELNGTGMLEIYNHQHLWDNRQERRVYDAFVDIWDREDLWVTIDRANLNPPKKVKGNPNGFIHWDADTSLVPPPIGVQGVLSLKKQDGDVGGFQCIPELFAGFDDWVKTQPEDRDPMHPDTAGLSITNIEMEAGDLLIFNSLLAHGVRPNHSDGRVRMAQYIS